MIEACRTAGYHIGMVLQLLDDLESARLDRGDLAQGKRTFPVWHGLAAGGQVDATGPRLPRVVSQNRYYVNSSGVWF